MSLSPKWPGLALEGTRPNIGISGDAGDIYTDNPTDRNLDIVPGQDPEIIMLSSDMTGAATITIKGKLGWKRGDTFTICRHGEGAGTLKIKEQGGTEIYSMGTTKSAVTVVFNGIDWLVTNISDLTSVT